MRDPSAISSSLSTRKVLLFALGLAAVLLFPTIFWPFDYDQGTFAYGGAAMLRGERPYIDFTDIKPPNIFYTYATAFAVFGNSVRAIRVFDYLNALLTIGLLFLLSLRLWKNEEWRTTAAIMASLAFILQYYIFGHWDTAQAETYSLPFLIGAVLLVLSDIGQVLLRSALAGLCIAIAFYFKFPNGLFIILVSVALWRQYGQDRRGRIVSIGSLIAGLIAGIGIESLYLALNGELIPLWHTTFSSTANYVATNYSGSFTVFQNLRTSVNVLGSVWAFALIVRSQAKERAGFAFGDAIVPALGIVVALIVVQIQNKGYTYHYAVLLPWADALIGAGVALVIHEGRRLWGSNSRFVAIPAVLLVLTYQWYSSAPLHQRFAELLRIARHQQPPNGYIMGDTLSNYVTANTRPTDRIFIFGFQPYVYWKTSRRPATKYLNTIHFKPSYVNSDDRLELVTSLLRNPPQLFLVEMGDRYTSQGSTNDDSRTTIRLRYPELELLLAERYTPRDTLQNTIAYLLRQ